MSVPRLLQVVRRHRAAMSDENRELVVACLDLQSPAEIPHRSDPAASRYPRQPGPAS